MVKPEFSIIIPLYNSDKTIEKCIDSILMQKFYNYEIIIVDDGSTDRSEEIVQRYATGDERIHVYHKCNRGASSARNFGLTQACGEYVIFIDSDDYIEEDLLSRLHALNQKESCELSIFGYSVWEHSKCIEQRTYSELGRSIEPREFRVKIFDEKLYKGYLWNKQFKLSIIQEHKVYFDEKIRINEDLLFCIEYSNWLTSKVAIYSFVGYNYIFSKSNTVNSENREALLSREIAARQLMKSVEKDKNVDGDYINTIRKFVTETVLMNVYRADFKNGIYDKVRIRNSMQVVSNYQVIQHCSRKVRVYYSLLKYIPRITYFSYQIYLRFRH